MKYMLTLSLILVYSFGKSGAGKLEVWQVIMKEVLNYKEQDKKANRYPEGYVNMHWRLYDNITNQGNYCGCFFPHLPGEGL